MKRFSVARPADLLSVEEARQRILDRFHLLENEYVSLEQSLGRVLGDVIRSDMQVPPFSNSSMDGFALTSETTRKADGREPVIVPVRQHIAAGTSTVKPIPTGEAARIMTGAPLPDGADAVIPFEEVEDRGDVIAVYSPVAPGACVRPAGQDVTRDQVVLSAGAVIGSRHIALLAALGFSRVPAVRRPVVAILATGDELVAPGQKLQRGQIYNSNTPMLVAAASEAGAFPVALAASSDDRESIASALGGASGADLLITSGGASVGDFDYIKDVVGSAGDVNFWRVRVRPGKPLLFGSIGPCPVIGLPGNPTSAMVTFEEFARPAIRAMLGAPPLRPEVDVIVDERIDNGGNRRTYARVSLSQRDGRFHAQLSGPQDSAMILPLANADGLLIIPEDCSELLPGETARVQVWTLP